jgi:polyphosphate kinase 2 (PPK2 family)
MGFCTPAQTGRFLELVPGVERAMAEDGIVLLKYWLEVSAGEQTRRLQSPHPRPAEDLEAIGPGPEVLPPRV